MNRPTYNITVEPLNSDNLLIMTQSFGPDFFAISLVLKTLQ